MDDEPAACCVSRVLSLDAPRSTPFSSLVAHAARSWALLCQL